MTQCLCGDDLSFSSLHEPRIRKPSRSFWWRCNSLTYRNSSLPALARTIRLMSLFSSFDQRDRSGIIASTRASSEKTRCSDAFKSVGLIPSARRATDGNKRPAIASFVAAAFDRARAALNREPYVWNAKIVPFARMRSRWCFVNKMSFSELTQNPRRSPIPGTGCEFAFFPLDDSGYVFARTGRKPSLR